MSTTTAPAPLVELLDLIQANVKVVISEYAAVNQVVPSLDSLVPGPFDTPESVTPELSEAIRIIEAACAQLSFTVASPGHVVTNKVYAFEEVACMRVVAEAKIADFLVHKPGGLHVDVLAKQSSLDPDKLARILRVLATKHCFTEVKPNVFANNRLSMKLLSTDPVSDLVVQMANEGCKASAYLGDALADPKTGLSTLPEDAPFTRAHGKTLFESHALPEGKARAERFAQAMVGWGEVTGKSMLPKVYPWATLPSDTQITICDVGGGNGHISLELARAFPRFKVILQDLPGAIGEGREHWAKELPSAIQNDMVEFVSLDFFKNAPVAGCDFYYLRHVLHDWPYAECLTILNNIRKSMKPSSRLLVHEFVLQYQARDLDSETLYKQVQSIVVLLASDPLKRYLTQAPEPLLANYGMGRVRPYEQDINMLSTSFSKERTLQEFVDIGKEAGFKFIKLWDSGEVGLVEFSLA